MHLHLFSLNLTLLFMDPKSLNANMKNVKHSHREVALFALRLAEANVFTPKSHSESDLAKYLISQLKVRNNVKQTALNKFWSHNPRSRYHLIRTVQDPTADADILTAYLDLFDDVFFLGSLKERCTLSLQAKSEGGLLERSNAVRSRNLTNGAVDSRISIHELEIDDRCKRLHIYLGILLHEMLTTFLRTYSCGGGLGCPESIEGAANMEYGAVWQDLGHALEIAAKDLLCLKLSLFRKWALVIELCRNKGDVPMAMESWGFEDEKMRELALETKKVQGNLVKGTGTGTMDWLVTQECGVQLERDGKKTGATFGRYM